MRRKRRGRKPAAKPSGKKMFRKNDEIQSPELFIIGDEGEQIGLRSLSEALAMADAAGMDLVEVAPQANPPVAKIINFGKLQYEQDKQLRKSRARKTGVETKGVRLGAQIGDHDMLVRVKAGQKFLDKGDKLKIELRLRGREKAHPELGIAVITRYIELLERDVVVEQPPKRMGGQCTAVVNSKK